ncbi:shikimate kinase [Halopelagius inordinatus]|uniref:Shikimate kinase n=1 Tax=Halopelagius inordinatus TaxID=553467 RepID=A0A1I2P679_9EURY|nr:shikimate kinase [Halopelagius inordinatus]SFG11618.1 shikimate kinase [Halopelagius inordinatus]
MHGRAVALGAGTVLNALATGVGSAFAIDAETTATVELDDSNAVTGEVAEDAAADTRLIERCVELAVERYGDGEDYGGFVRTESDVPMAAGLKSSSAAANASVLATAAALGVDPDREEACRLGVRAARETGVAVTGAFDDASASMLGGVTVTDNGDDELLARDEVEWDVLVWTPEERAYSADADVERCANVAPMAELVADLALDGRYAEAMTVNGLAFSAALGFPADPAVEAMPHATGVSLSGTGPSVVAVAEQSSAARQRQSGDVDETRCVSSASQNAERSGDVGDRTDLERVRDLWDRRDGRTRLTTTRTDGAHTL